MRIFNAVLAAALLAATPAAAQQPGLTGPEVRLPAKLDAQLREYFAQDEALLIDRLRDSQDEIENRERTETLELSPEGEVILSD